MKRFWLKTTLSAFLLLGATSLASCGGGKLPTTNYEKVKFAFNGVESSFRNPKAGKRSLALKSRLGGSNTEAGLSTIFGLFTEEDKRDGFLDDVEYNQPPMVQFQYLKKVLEKVGDGYSFGTKYFDTMTGEVLLDIETGLESTKESDKFNYTFGLGMDINIDGNDLITADVSFDIKIARGAEEYNTKWYVAIELNYDMANNSPNYTMTMVTENNESDLPYYQHYTYEYDYVEVKDSQINEWRKFCMDNGQRLIKDGAHPTFDSYSGKDAKYRVDACSWYKDGVYYKSKRTRQAGTEAKTIGQALFGDLGLNATEINADAFFAKSSTQNSVLKTCYEEFGKLAKKDIIYDLLTKEEPEPERQTKTAIRAMNHDLSGGAENIAFLPSTTVREIFSGYIDAYGEKGITRLFYVDQNGGFMDEITDLNSLSYFFKLKHKAVTVMFGNIEETLESAYKRLVQDDEILDVDLENECEIVFADKVDVKIAGSMPFYYAGDLPDTYVKPDWPQAFKNMGVPEYEGERMEYDYDPKSQGSTIYLGIRNSTYEEGEAYCRKLIQNGFARVDDYGPAENEVIFKKALSDQYNLFVSFVFGKNLNSFRLSAWKEEAPAQSSEPVQPFHVYVLGDCNNWGKNGAIEFEASFENETWTFTLKDFRAAPNESFYFTTDPQDPGNAFGYDNIVEGPTEMLAVNWDRGPFVIKAVVEFTATFTMGEDRQIRMSTSGSPAGDSSSSDSSSGEQTGIQFLTIVGSFNDWSETEGVIEMENKGDRFEKIVGFDAGVQFKIMQNHSWTPSYGYDEIKAFQSADMKARFAPSDDKYHNVVVLQPLTFKLTATDDGAGHAVFKVNIIY